MYCLIHGDLAGLKQLGPAKRMALAESRQNGFRSAMHPLRNTVALRVVQCSVEQGYVLPITELLELLTSELSSIVQDFAPWCPVVGDVLPQSI